MPENLGEQAQEDLIRTAERLDRTLYSAEKPASPPPSKFLSFGFNFAGALFGLYLLRVAPAWIANRVTAAFALYKSGKTPLPLSAESLENLKEAGRLRLKYLGKNSGRAAVLILMSHPKTVGEEAPLLGDLVHNALRAARFLSPWKKLKLLHAIDPFALDTLPWPAGAFYAGVLSQGHLAVNRQPGRFSPSQNFLFRDSLYTRAFFSLARSLKKGDAVCLALSGAVAHNARVFFTIREWAQRLYFSLKKSPGPKRLFQKEILARLTRGENCATLTGVLSEPERKSLAAFLRGAGADALPAKIAELEEELRLETPCRERFFKVLFGRLPAKGIPVLLIALRHGPGRTVSVRPPVLVQSYARGDKTVTFLAEGRQKQGALSAFARDFTTASFAKK